MSSAKCERCGVELAPDTNGRLEADDNGTNHTDARCAERLVEQRDALKSDTPWDELAKLLGCPQWDYPGQIIRDVKSVIQSRDTMTDMHRKLDDTYRATLAQLEAASHRAEVAERRWQSVIDEAARLMARDAPPMVFARDALTVPVETYNEMAAMAFRFAGYCKTAQEMLAALRDPPATGRGER